MKITYPPETIPFLRNKHLLLDANIFRDYTKSPSVYTEFFNLLKESDITLATVNEVKYEILKGSNSKNKYDEKNKLIDDIIDVLIPSTKETQSLIYSLIQEYGIEGSAVGITDLTLGAMLKQFRRNICLMTRDTTDFTQSIFDLKFIINASHNRGIFTYGIYQY